MAAPAAAAQVPGKLTEVEQLYAAGDFDGASHQINELLTHEADLPRAELARVFLMKARLEMAYGRQPEIRLWLTKAYQVNPQLTLDPVKDPPSLIAAWRELRKHQTQAAVRAPAPEEPSPGRFLAGLMPLGLGHLEAGRPRDGALFLSTESLALLAASTLPRAEDDGTGQPRARRLGGTLLVGIYGYELTDLLPELATYEPGWTAGLSYGLAFFPLGVGQAQNHEPVKAAALAATQVVLLSVATLGADAPQRQAAWALCGVAWGYGIIDALVNHSGIASSSNKAAGLGLAPLPGGGLLATVAVPL
jgi:hypothetical protein